ncbi:hypothetical protein EGK14_09440 [Erwinia sp. 198]|nr:hypothetical protein EGK14_09440 [Erwinia sp. 198]
MFIRQATDVAALVNSRTRARSNAHIAIAIALGDMFPDACDLGALAFGMKDVTKEFGLTPAGAGMVASAAAFGAIVGALLAVRLMPRLGALRMTVAGYGCQFMALACRPDDGTP